MNLVITIAIDTDDDLLAVLDFALGTVGRLLDLALLEAAVDGPDRATHRVDLREIVVRRVLELVGEALHVIAAGEGIRGGRDSRLVRDDLLRPQRKARGRLRRQRERFVARVGMQALGSAED